MNMAEEESASRQEIQCVIENNKTLIDKHNNQESSQQNSRSSAFQPIRFAPYDGTSDDPLYSYTDLEVCDQTGKKRKRGNRKFRCKIKGCNSRKTGLVIGNGLTNIRSHFQRCHPSVNTSIRFIDNDNSNKTSQSTIKCTIGNIAKSNRHRKFPMRSTEEKKFIRLCAEWVALNMVPMTTVEQTGFRNLMEYSNERFNNLSRMTIRRELSKLGAEINQFHKSLFATITFFPLRVTYGPRRILICMHRLLCHSSMKSGSFIPPRLHVEKLTDATLESDCLSFFYQLLVNTKLKKRLGL